MYDVGSEVPTERSDMTPAEIRSMSSERLKREWDADDR